MPKTIYAAGAITGLSEIESSTWRKELKKAVEEITSRKWLVINPCEHIDFDKYDDEQVNKEGMIWDLYKIKKCDLIVCDFSNPNSIGTSWELGLAKERDIPVIGYYSHGYAKVHPWWKMYAMATFDDFEELIFYINNNFLKED